MSRRQKWWLAVLFAMAAAAVCAVAVRSWRSHRLPYHDRFAQNSAGEWEQYSGVWRLKDGMVMNVSDERGAKVIAGSSSWTNYQMTADITMLGHGGDAGIILRANTPEKGINSYSGYYLGLRSHDHSIVAGVSDYDWIEVSHTPLPGGVHFGAWYRIHAVVVGCDVAAQFTNLQTGQTGWSGLHQASCQPAGRIGLRSLATGAAWRNIHVEAATQADLQSLLVHAAPLETPRFPSREDDYTRMRRSIESEELEGNRNFLQPSGLVLQRQRAQSPISTVLALSNTHADGTPAALRGVVTLTDPLYIQDATGGIAVHLLKPDSLNVGDEIELIGQTEVHGNVTVFAASQDRMLWDRTPLVPASITSTQAAGGAFEGSLVELNGELVSKNVAPDGSATLELADLAQRFRVSLPHELSNEPYRHWRVGSTLRVRGICTDISGAEANGDPFTIFPRSASDVEVLSGPPWNRGWRLFGLIVAGIGFVAACVYFYLKAERWRMRAILHERERLAMDMHDTLAQSFAGVGFHLQSMRKGLREQGTVPLPLMQKLDAACDLTAHTHREASARILAMHPSAETDGDLLTLLQRSTIAMLNGVNLPMELERDGQPRRLSVAVRDALLRIGREAVANVLRHSRATQLTFRLVYQEKIVQFVIMDNGVGFDMEEKRNSFGLQSMGSRAEEIGARLLIQSTPGFGSVITISAPYGRRFSLLDWVRFQWTSLGDQSSSRRTRP